MSDWLAHTRERQNSLRALAELTGGVAVVNTNDVEKWLKAPAGKLTARFSRRPQ